MQRRHLRVCTLLPEKAMHAVHDLMPMLSTSRSARWAMNVEQCAVLQGMRGASGGGPGGSERREESPTSLAPCSAARVRMHAALSAATLH
jgi:hypothetical protein